MWRSFTPTDFSELCSSCVGSYTTASMDMWLRYYQTLQPHAARSPDRRIANFRDGPRAFLEVCSLVCNAWLTSFADARVGRHLNRIRSHNRSRSRHVQRQFLFIFGEALPTSRYLILISAISTRWHFLFFFAWVRLRSNFVRLFFLLRRYVSNGRFQFSC